MESANSKDQRGPFSEFQYGLYMMMMALQVVSFLRLEHNMPIRKLIKAVKISATLFTVNFFAAWFAFQENTRGFVVYSNPKAFNVIFYTTMISAPLVLVFTLLHHLFIAKQNDDLLM